jgi:hypothetical protein
MARLVDDIEEFLLTGQQDRAIQTLSQRRDISLQQAGEQISIRMLEILVELHGEIQQRRARISASGRNRGVTQRSGLKPELSATSENSAPSARNPHVKPTPP